MKTAFITGITGQDGRHLTELLHSKGYKVFGLIRGQNNPRLFGFSQKYPYVDIIEGDLTDLSSLINALKISKPDEVYNLGAISHVGYSFKCPLLTNDVTAKGVANILEAIRIVDLTNKIRFYQASTSEMFGGLEYNRPPGGYNENSTFHPRSPYGVAKLYGHWMTVNYRESYKMFNCTGILFNHEGEYRGLEFVTRKISNAVAKISLGLQKELRLGILDTKRDWGYAGDYVEGMWLMLQQSNPDDYVLATGETHSIEEFVIEAFNVIGISNWKDFVVYDKSFSRPAEVDILLGDSSKAHEILKWKRNVNFKQLVALMIKNDLTIGNSVSEF